MSKPVADAICAAAYKHNLNPHLIAAVIHQESKGNPYAVRYEQGFYKRYIADRTPATLRGYIPRQCSFATEKTLRSTSFGLMQVMGNTAREAGFNGEFLTELLDVSKNVAIGTQILRDMIDASKDTETALLKWNGGGNPAYPKEVIEHMDSGVFHYLLIV